MVILIIGSKGFIGSATTRYFNNLNGVQVVAADVQTDYGNSQYIQVDATNADFGAIFRQYQFDWCINCSGAASVPDSFQNPLRDYTLNVVNVAKLLNAIKENNPSCKLIQLSSAAVYGNPKQIPIKEDLPLNPLSPYGLHKKQAEELCALYHEQFGISSFILRIFSAYGPGLKKQILWDLYQKAKYDDAIILYGKGNETRDFVYIDDIPKAFHAIIRHTQKSFDIINLASGNEITINDLAKSFLTTLGTDKTASFTGEQRTGDPLFWQANIDKLTDLGFRADHSWEIGLSKLCVWLKENE